MTQREKFGQSPIDYLKENHGLILEVWFNFEHKVWEYSIYRLSTNEKLNLEIEKFYTYTEAYDAGIIGSSKRIDHDNKIKEDLVKLAKENGYDSIRF